MRRRSLLGVLLPAIGLAGCGLSTRPYAERREWPLLVRRPQALPPRTGGPVLLIRAMRAGPGMETRGLQSLRADGSIKSEFYEEWAVPPAEAVEDALRRWLGDCGLFGAVLAPGSRLAADLVLEAELDALWTEAARGEGYAALGVTVLTASSQPTKVLLQQSVSSRAPVSGSDPPADVAAMAAAAAGCFRAIEALLAGPAGAV